MSRSTALNSSKNGPRIQRAFLAWLDESAHRFYAAHNTATAHGAIDFGFDVGAALLRDWLNRREIIIAVDYEEEIWDLILDREVDPERTEGGVICGLCAEDKRRVFREPRRIVA